MVHRPAAGVYRFGEDVPASVSFFHPAWHFKLLYPPSSAHASKPHSAFNLLLGLFFALCFHLYRQRYLGT